MHEYRLAAVDRSARKKTNSLRLDDWVLCRIYNKKGTVEKQNGIVSMEAAESSEIFERKPDILNRAGRGLPPPPESSAAAGMFGELVYLDTSDSVPKLHTDSSCSEHVVSPEFTCEREVQSEPTKLTDWDKSTLDLPFNYLDATMDSAFTSQFQSCNQMYPLQDMFLYTQKPF
ncbi:hypothetical protein NMG60_11035658 [Bertholletia excelsa]